MALPVRGKINPVGHDSALRAGNFQAEALCPSDGTIKNFYVKRQVAPGAGKTATYKVFKNGVVTTVQVSITGTSTTGSDTSNSFSVVARDRILIEYSSSNGVDNSSSQRFGLVYEMDTEGEFPICHASRDTTNRFAIEYAEVSGWDVVFSTTEANHLQAVRDMTLKHMRVRLNSAPGTGASWTITVRKNSADTALTTTISGIKTTGASTNDVSFSAGDLIDSKHTPSFTIPGNKQRQIGLRGFNTPIKDQPAVFFGANF